MASSALSEIERLRWENSVLREKNWASGRKLKHSEWFFLVNSRHKPSDGNPSLENSLDFCDMVMKQFAEAVKQGDIITLNRKTHRWDNDHIRNVKIRYVNEIGKGKLKKDGTRGKSGGTVHIHCLLTVHHTSNITLTWESLHDFFQPRMLELFGKNPFVSHPKLIPQHRVEEYMEKGFETAEWKQIEF